MIDFENIPEEEKLQLTSIIQKNVERSEIDKYYLYSEKPIEKALLYIWCYRFLVGITNIADRKLKMYQILLNEVNYNRDLYIKISKLIFEINNTLFNKSRNINTLNNLVLEDQRVTEVIDAFSILLERQNVLSMSRLKGIILEGQSAKEYKKIFSTNMSDLTQNLNEEEEMVEEQTPEEIEEMEINEIRKESDLPALTKEELKENEEE